MNVLIRSAKIIDSRSPYNNKIRDILIVKGKIEKIGVNITAGNKKRKQIEYKEKDLYISPGWFDMNVNFGEPGFEQKETLETGINASIRGGFTGVQVMPNTSPKLDNKGQIDFIFNKTKDSIVDVIPAGNITKNQKGDEIVEMHDMCKSGCKSFTDDKKSLKRNEIMKVAMLYAKDTGSVIMNYANDPAITNNGNVNEGRVSVKLGLKGIPSIAEKMMVERDINLCEYTESKLHLSYLSVKESVLEIKKAKKKNLKLSCGVVLYNLFLNEDMINNFDTRYKMLPPLREQKDINALIKALKDKTIDVITSNHSPCDEESKKIEFNQADFGIIGLESAFGLIGAHLSKYLTINEVIEKIAINPRKILDLDSAEIKEGEIANLTLFNPKKEWQLEKRDLASKSINTPFLGNSMKGKALAIYNKGKFLECK